MSPEPALGSTTRAGTAVSVAALLLLCACFTVGAVGAFPLWDDAWIWLLLREKGPEAVQASFSDRPVNAWLWATLARSESLFWKGAFASQALLWPALGIISALLWRQLFPEKKRFAWVAACVAVAPFVTKVQAVTVNIAMASLLPAVLAWVAVLLAWRFAEASDTRGRLGMILAPLVLTLGVLIQEYALPVVIAGSFLLFDYWRRAQDASVRKRALLAIALLIVTAAAAYGLYLFAADPEARGDVRPWHALGVDRSVSWYFLTLASAIWRGVVGGFWRCLLDLPSAVAAHLWAGLFGLLIGGLLFFGCRSSGQAPSGGRTGTWLALLGALAAGLAPVVVMGRVPWDPAEGMTSRYGLSVLPVVAALMVQTALGLARGRWQTLPVLVLGLVAGVTAAAETRDAIDERLLVSRLGAVLRQHAVNNDNTTIAVVPLPERPIGPRRQWELVARLGWDWPLEETKRLWAYRYGGGPPLYYKEEATRVLGPRDRCRPPRRIRKRVRLVERSGPVGQVLWVAPGADDSVVIEPYCQPASERRSP